MRMDGLIRVDSRGELVALPDHHARMAALAEGERLHRAFRPDMEGPYEALMAQVAAGGGGVVQLFDDGAVRSLAVWRAFHTTYCGLRFEVDDLVTDPDYRSRQYGSTLLDWLEMKARRLGCKTLTLNSATRRADAHRFYFRQRYEILGFHFSKSLGRAGAE